MIGEQNSRAVVMLSSESEFAPTEKVNDPLRKFNFASALTGVTG